eukprot:CAMPEP_0118980764 /NCGR_PEP_ID=MMETSP1173-20130426/29067_1 /TAXON_ID=1034831 /ORGANISM="Rhizochromulina marina cf, Strain CCMP1243" /LENGTH=33 /DNA_ID= /DNA_START= /DNA_END= /DNA_ORIENTATION=
MCLVLLVVAKVGQREEAGLQNSRIEAHVRSFDG